MKFETYDLKELKAKVPYIFMLARGARNPDVLRDRLAEFTLQIEFDTFYNYDEFDEGSIIRVRDCALALRNVLKKRSDDLAGFSVAKALHDLAHNRARTDLSPAFFADMLHLLTGVQGAGKGRSPEDRFLTSVDLKGRDAAVQRSRELDDLWMEQVWPGIQKYESGLAWPATKRHTRRREKILKVLKASESDWSDWRWQVKHLARKVETLEALVELTPLEREAIRAAKEQGLPFGVTPYYLSLMDDEPVGRDRAVRAQVFPPLSYVQAMAKARSDGECSLDFMLESDTSPIDLITRRYPAIAIFKPFNACPQICVYCQRNWEIHEPMGPGALAPPEQIEAALKWVEDHPALHELLVTGGDPLALGNERLKKLFGRIARIKSLEQIRIGTRTLVTMPMRVNDQLADLLAALREPGKRQVAVVTHVQHPAEVTEEMMAAVNRLRVRGIPVYNQLVYTFYVSRRFEAAALRRHLRLVGIDPYYTFAMKGKEETNDYRVPFARLLQEQKEEARLLPGLTRTDEAVYNVGKNYLRASQHRDLISILADGSRVYEFHPWEKNISKSLQTFVARDLPILDYLERLEAIGEDPADYNTIWYYF